MYLWYAVGLGFRCLLDKFTSVMLVQYSRMASLSLVWSYTHAPLQHQPIKGNYQVCSFNTLRLLCISASSIRNGPWFLELNYELLWNDQCCSTLRNRNFTVSVGLQVTFGFWQRWWCWPQVRLYHLIKALLVSQIWISILQFYNLNYFLASLWHSL